MYEFAQIKTGLRQLAAAMFAAIVILPGIAFGQGLKEQLVGAWRLTTIYNEINGVKTYFYGEQPVGLLMFDRSGNISQYLSKPGLPAFAVANRQKGTDREYREVMQGMLAGFGTFTVDGNTVTIKWVASSYPNRAGSAETRIYKVTGDELIAINPSGSSGGTAYSRWVRAN